MWKIGYIFCFVTEIIQSHDTAHPDTGGGGNAPGGFQSAIKTNEEEISKPTEEEENLLSRSSFLQQRSVYQHLKQVQLLTEYELHVCVSKTFVFLLLEVEDSCLDMSTGSVSQLVMLVMLTASDQLFVVFESN